ncbi:phosphoribosylanthranilate isomerase [Candidatus Daviesbacteria bacterium]|nr:phosphoribosylanthranilate isomerase [Candidatus Daviesbacteria bacterium]
MKTQVKICGIRSLVAAQTAVYSGAKFLGFNFVSGSRRKVSPEFAKQIITQIKSQVNVVGVFQNQSIEEVNKIADFLDLDFVQLHGDENQEYIDSLNHPVIKTLALESDFDLNRVVKNIKSFNVQYFLADRAKQGQGKMLNLEKLNMLCKSYQIFIAGGLTPLNIVEVVRAVEPFAVDVASGIETRGVEDLEKIKSFIERVKNA